ncbi:MAG TPA: DUF397 domain-containing protein [Pseudonocardiaceae bacterium]|nr:DUF397 domain-containing protein [Pseudonocardiaceae bacterium]
MTLSGQSEPQWRKSSHSGGGNDCVEIAGGATETAIRDSKNPNGPRLRFGAAHWSAFLGGVSSAPRSR